MEFTRRLGQTQATRHFPLPIDGLADWKEVDPGVWQTDLALPDLPPKHIIVPSFALVGADFRFQFQLQHPEGSNTLRSIPADSDLNLFSPPTDNSSNLSDHIDCWHSQSEVTAAILVLRVQCAEQPQQYVLATSVRPLEIEPHNIRSSSHSPINQMVQPPAISQMAASANIRNRICSPTALAMALSHLLNVVEHTQIEDFWTQLVEDCYDPVTKAYGMWPQAIFQASRLGVLATVECNADWQKVEQALTSKTPVVCSVRFAKDELQHAPLTQTAGHLVLLYGFTGNSVLVLDPAAENPAEVPRIYDRAQFTTAWLRQRGAAYFFSIEDRSFSVLESQQRSN